MQDSATKRNLLLDDSLRYPGFSIVLMQYFPFVLKDKSSLDSSFFSPLSENENIDNQIFKIVDKSQINRFNLKGFRFKVEFNEPYHLKLECDVKVQMAYLLKNIASIRYKFYFEKENINTDCPLGASTDHIISLLSTHLSGEHWSSYDNETDINVCIKNFHVMNFPIDEFGNIKETRTFSLKNGTQIFDQVSSLYRRAICNYAEEIFKSEKLESSDELHYAMVDIWENVAHVEDSLKNENLFKKSNSKSSLTEAEIIEHIENYHKKELIGLMTLYPGEWRYRDERAYKDVCGDNIAIDTDDLVLANTNLAVVIGTYRRRGSDSPTNWEKLDDRKIFGVSWAEYLSILEMLLAKKYIISIAKDKLIETSYNILKQDISEIIGKIAELSIKITYLQLSMDVVKFSKFVSHKVMHDRTAERLEIAKDNEELKNVIESLDSNLQNLGEYKSMKSEYALNLVLIFISIISAFEILFQSTELPFLGYFGIAGSRLAVTLIFIVIFFIIFGTLFAISKLINDIIKRVKGKY